MDIPETTNDHDVPKRPLSFLATARTGAKRKYRDNGGEIFN